MEGKLGTVTMNPAVDMNTVAAMGTATAQR